MTETKHTPGPWEVSKDATPDYAPQFTVYAEEDGNRVATAFRSEANAALIAAAPDMYQALCRILAGGMSNVEVDSIAAAALAKAEGR